MIQQIVLHPQHEPMTHIATIYDTTGAKQYKKLYKCQTIYLTPYAKRLRLSHVKLLAADCQLYWLTAWPWLNKFFERDVAKAWRAHKDSQPQHLAKRNWPLGTRYCFARKVALSKPHNVGAVYYEDWNSHNILILTPENKHLLNTHYLWHCIEQVEFIG